VAAVELAEPALLLERFRTPLVWLVDDQLRKSIRMSPQTQRADDAKIWHARGMDARFHSLQIRDPEKRLLLLQIAHSHDYWLSRSKAENRQNLHSGSRTTGVLTRSSGGPSPLPSLTGVPSSFLPSHRRVARAKSLGPHPGAPRWASEGASSRVAPTPNRCPTLDATLAGTGCRRHVVDGICATTAWN
jgi:hypothetical protein